MADREPSTAKAWLVEQPQIEIVARDRGGGYAQAAAQALPYAEQVADRWHLMENASHAFLDAVRKSMRQVRIAIGTATVNPKLLTAAERLQYEGYLRREEANAIIRGLVSEGVSMKEIVRRTGHSRKLVRSVVSGRGQNKSSPKSYAKAERNRNDAVDRMWNIRSLWIAIDMRQF